MAININDNQNPLAPKILDNRYGPYTSVSSANSAIPIAYRVIGLTVGVLSGTTSFSGGRYTGSTEGIIEYWYYTGITDSDLIVKTIQLPQFSGGTITGLTINGDLTVTGNTILNTLTANTLNVTGNTVLNGLTATTISAETYYNVPFFTAGTGSLSIIVRDSNNSTDSTSSFIVGASNAIYSNSEFSFSEGSGNYIYSNSPYSHTQNFFNLIQTYSPYSHAGGVSNILSGNSSFIHGNDSSLYGNNSALFGHQINGTSDNTVYVPYLNLNYIPTTYDESDNVLVRAADGTVKTKSVSVLYDVTGITAQTLTMVDNSNNPVFQITDNSGDSLLQINDISGIPVFEVFSNGGIKFGSYPTLLNNNQSLYGTTGVTATTGTTIVYSLPTTAYTGAFFDYTLQNGLNLRAGSVVSVWTSGGTSIEYTETSTNDIGNTTSVTFNMSATSSNVYFQASAVTSGWTIKSMVRTI